MTTGTLELCASVTKPTPVQTAAVSIAVRTDSAPVSRSRPAGKATAGWNTARRVTIQNAWLVLQLLWSLSVSDAAPKPYSNTLIASMAIHGSQIIQERE